MKLIDKDAVVAEIERRIKTNKECMLGLRILDYYQGKVDALNDTISFIDTLEVKEVDGQKEQFEKNRLAACDKQTEEEAEIERDFVMSIVKNEHRQPTFDDAIKYGMKLREKQMMDKAIDATCFGFQGAALFSFRLPADSYLVGSKVKVIVVDERNEL